MDRDRRIQLPNTHHLAVDLAIVKGRGALRVVPEVALADRGHGKDEELVIRGRSELPLQLLEPSDDLRMGVECNMVICLAMLYVDCRITRSCASSPVDKVQSDSPGPHRRCARLSPANPAKRPEVQRCDGNRKGTALG